MFERDPLVTTVSSYKRPGAVRNDALSGEEILKFTENGFLRVGRVLSDEKIEQIRLEIAKFRKTEQEIDLLDLSQWEVGEGGVPQEPGKTVSFLFNLWRTSPVYRTLIMDERFALWSSQVLGCRDVRVMEDNALSKDPLSGGELKWHQDFSYWPLAQPNAVTLWIALDDVTLENGAMHMAVGSHLLGERLPTVFGTGASYFKDRRPKSVMPIVEPHSIGLDTEVMTLSAGEATLHHSLTWHASGPNKTNNPRRAAVCRYVADGTIWLGERRYEYNYSSSEVGLNLGDPIGGAYFPVVKKKELV